MLKMQKKIKFFCCSFAKTTSTNNGDFSSLFFQLFKATIEKR